MWQECLYLPSFCPRPLHPPLGDFETSFATAVAILKKTSDALEYLFLLRCSVLPFLGKKK